MAGGIVDGQYSKKVAFIFTFNLIVGVGSLALPYGFSKAGLILGTLFLGGMAILVFITGTWILEALSAANYILLNEKKKQQQQQQKDSERDPLIDHSYSVNDNSNNSSSMDQQHQQQIAGNDDHDEDNNSLIEDNDIIQNGDDQENIIKPKDEFEIKTKVEVGQLMEMFTGKLGSNVFYGVLIVYLFGDLAIYAATVPSTLSNVTGGWGKFTSDSVYYFYLFLFACFVVPFSMFNFQKTKYLQIATLVTRNVAFFLMIILSIIFIAQGNGTSVKELPMFEISEIASIFGVSVYSFMCHHSLPNIITPIQNKSKLPLLLGFDFILVFIAYVTLCIVSLFAFGSVTNPECVANSSIHTFVPCQIQSLYIYNFTSYNNRFISDFLSLFPVFTLSTNYILISITLRNNLSRLITWKSDKIKGSLRNAIFSIISSFVPIIIAFITKNVSLLVNVTGSFAGLAIIFVMPVIISYYSNKMLNEKYGVSNPNKSPFSSKFFYLLILVISGICLVLAVYKLILTYK